MRKGDIELDAHGGSLVLQVQVTQGYRRVWTLSLIHIYRDASGKLKVTNNLPGMADNPIVHVRPHTSKAAYKFADGTAVSYTHLDVYKRQALYKKGVKTIWIILGIFAICIIGTGLGVFAAA